MHLKILTSVVCAILLPSIYHCQDVPQRPNIVFIVADDLGWNDVGFRNKDIFTKNIDYFANNGVILDQSYVAPVCTPSRHAFLTGSYPFHDGLQHLVIMPLQRVCTPTNMTLLPMYLKQLGYSTHIVGKWHLGFHKWECTPTFRGFDSFYGFYNGAEDYYSHDLYGFQDLMDNLQPVTDHKGIYGLDLFRDRTIDIISKHDKSNPLFLYLPFQSVHDPIQVPKDYEDMYPNIETEGRRKYSGMVTALDDAIGNITETLKAEGLYDNTLFVFSTDNGGMISSFGNNYPLRGGKTTVYEGGTRGVAFMYGAGIQSPGRVYSGLMHAVDWTETIVSAAGGEKGFVNTRDGIDQWEAISQDKKGPRNEFVYNYDPFEINNRTSNMAYQAIRVGDYKLIIGNPGLFRKWYKPEDYDRVVMTKTPKTYSNIDEYSRDWYYDGVGDSPSDASEAERPGKFTDVNESYQLFNLKHDPNERLDLSNIMPGKVMQLKRRLRVLARDAVPANFPLPSLSMLPIRSGGVWSPTN